MLVAMAYRKISSHRQTVPISGHWFAWHCDGRSFECIGNNGFVRVMFKMIFSKKRKSLVVKRCPMSVLTYFPVSSIRLRDGSIFSHYHQVDPSKSRLEHGNYSFLLSRIPNLDSFQCHRSSIFRDSIRHYSFRQS